ncbi:hypothetical protein HPB51_005613 [Rhipicephalus microplus]|uniref:Mediator of RNA polymerase II transcription subunit 25 n=1 Tax=Rhipicephalus microplus TaxID=6941 RepID=A0A9J6DTH9_RHIMP|nr:hypothetical protein HPB51_005613 [Rhipicephalus microplus]
MKQGKKQQLATYEKLRETISAKISEVCLPGISSASHSGPTPLPDHGYALPAVQECVVYYLCGYIVHSFLKHVNCAACISSIQSTNTKFPASLLTLAREFRNGSLKHPSTELYTMLKRVEEKLSLVLGENHLCADMFWDALDVIKDCDVPSSNSTTYALVVFMASDCAPEPAAICHAPTTNVAKLLSWFDRVSFVGGAGESCSHIAEGLGTALQVFDDFQALREPGSVVQKHCILVCNSPPYRLPTLESPMYAGHSVEQLATIMAERQVNFSILSPRKIPALYKLYEKAGGDLQTAMCKNYAKDRRHMVLLRGYQLQERPVSPPIAVSEVKVEPTPSPSAVAPHNPRSPATTPAGVGQKRPAGGSPPNPREAKMFKQPTSQVSASSSAVIKPSQQMSHPLCQVGVDDTLPQIAAGVVLFGSFKLGIGPDVDEVNLTKTVSRACSRYRCPRNIHLHS